MHRAIIGVIRRAAAIHPGKLATEVVACAVATSLLGVAVLGHRAASDPAPAWSNPPTFDSMGVRTGDRMVGAGMANQGAPSGAALPVNSALLFAHSFGFATAGVLTDDDAPSVRLPMSEEPSRTVPATVATRAGARPRSAMAEAAPLPPQRSIPARTTVAAPPAAVAVQAPAPEPAPGLLARVLPSGLLARVLPSSLRGSELLSTGRAAWDEVASIGEALVDHLTP